MNPPEVASSETRGLKVEGSPGVESMKTPPRCPGSTRAVSMPWGRGGFCRAVDFFGAQEMRTRAGRRIKKKVGSDRGMKRGV
jgi:hypothetical protein